MNDTPRQPSLRPATADDALCLGVLAMQVFLDTYATDGIRPPIAREALDSYAPAVYQRLLQTPGLFILVAEQQGHLVGFAQVAMGATHTLVDHPAPAELDRLYVQEHFTGRGLVSCRIIELHDLCFGSAVPTSKAWHAPDARRRDDRIV